MKCVRCGTDNIYSAAYCIACKTPLRFRRRSERYRKRKNVLTATIVIVWLGCFTFFFKDIFFPESPYFRTENSERAEDKRQKDAGREKLFAELHILQTAERASLGKTGDTHGQEKGGNVDNFPVKMAEEGFEVVSGTLKILDSWSREVARIRVALLDDGWLAIPARACLGGTTWSFLSDSGDRAYVQGGSWQEGTVVGVWQVNQALGTDKSVGLAIWDRNMPLAWLSIESDNDLGDVHLSSFQHEGDFTIATLPSRINEVGIFVQGVDIVGWSFGQWLMGAYLWNPGGKYDEAQQQNITVADFYNMTFANGREERFSIALASLNETDLVNSIALFLEGFQHQPKLSASDTPYYLLPDEIIKQLRSLIKKAIASGSEKQVIELFDSDTLKLIADIDLFLDIVEPIARVYGDEAAIAAIEESGSFIVQGLGVNVPELNEFHLSFYQNWLQTLVTNNSIEEGGSVYATAMRYYGNDPYLHILATELELLKGNWREAERLLFQRNYPSKLLDRYELLARQISDLKGQEGDIVVRFQPGSTRIPLSSFLNGFRRQEFLVDTGASMVTIPSSTVAALGLEIISGGHYEQRKVSTAGGVIMASEVIIDSIEIGGWVESEVKALVLDIPDQPGLGLLGLNYLSRFKVDLRSEEGVLSLTPQ